MVVIIKLINVGGTYENVYDNFMVVFWVSTCDGWFCICVGCSNTV